MPSPVGHSILGLAIGLACDLPSGPWRTLWRRIQSVAAWLVAAVMISNVPDLDYIPGLFRGNWNILHHGFTHSLGWCLLTALGLWLLWRSVRSDIGMREFGFLAVLLLAHIAADYSCADGLAPYGVMAFWPFSDEYFIAADPIFWSLHKMTVAELFELHNAQAIGVELLWTLPVAAAVLWWKARCGNTGAERTPPASAGPPRRKHQSLIPHHKRTSQENE